MTVRLYDKENFLQCRWPALRYDWIRCYHTEIKPDVIFHFSLPKFIETAPNDLWIVLGAVQMNLGNEIIFVWQECWLQLQIYVTDRHWIKLACEISRFKLVGTVIEFRFFWPINIRIRIHFTNLESEKLKNSASCIEISGNIGFGQNWTVAPISCCPFGFPVAHTPYATRHILSAFCPFYEEKSKFRGLPHGSSAVSLLCLLCCSLPSALCLALPSAPVHCVTLSTTSTAVKSFDKAVLTIVQL